MTSHKQYGRSFEIHENESKLITRYKKKFSGQNGKFRSKKNLENNLKIEI